MISIYMNQHVPCAITEGLRLRGVDVITAYEDGASDMGDAELRGKEKVYASQEIYCLV